MKILSRLQILFELDTFLHFFLLLHKYPEYNKTITRIFLL